MWRSTTVLATAAVLTLLCPRACDQAGLTDFFIEGFSSVGKSVGNATKSVVDTFREWGDRVSPPKTVIVKGEKIEPFLSRICRHPATERKSLLGCLLEDERHLLHSSWPTCLGRGAAEIRDLPELLHWLCHSIRFAEKLDGLEKIQACIFKEVDLAYAMSLYRLCVKKLP